MEIDSATGPHQRPRDGGPIAPVESLDAGYLEEALRTHFAALLDPACDDLLRQHYPDGISLEVGQPLARSRSGS